jgi:hypothetical protein
MANRKEQRAHREFLRQARLGQLPRTKKPMKQARPRPLPEQRRLLAGLRSEVNR